MTEIKLFNKTSDTKLVKDFRGIFSNLLESLPEYSAKISKLGVFIGEKIDRNILAEAIEYTKMPAEPWDQVKGMMASSYHDGVQAISISRQDYVNAEENEIKHTILHELAHGLFGHGIRDYDLIKSFQDKYLNELTDELSLFVSNVLFNFQRF